MNEAQPLKDLKNTILERLEKEGISPRSRLYWLSHEYALWGAWGATVLIGALALSIASFASLHVGYALYEATHDDFLTFALGALPYLWLLTFFLMVAAAYFNLRHTKRGYRYPIILVIGSSVGFSIIGGAVLHNLGAGWYFDRFLGENVPAYQSRAEFEEAMWQKPVAGRLVGHAIPSEIMPPTGTVAFRDARDQQWSLRTTELREREGALLISGKKVRILMATSTLDGEEVWYVCAVFPWLLDHAPMIKEWRDERKAFVEDVQTHREKVKEYFKKELEPGFGHGAIETDSCNSISPFRSLEEVY